MRVKRQIQNDEKIKSEKVSDQKYLVILIMVKLKNFILGEISDFDQALNRFNNLASNKKDIVSMTAIR